ncbi:MAG: hypothetical protein LBC82_06785 [Oscillospiraceae bacterium]|jgi:hypothetical protein|nr:hypothetical protein [Oscillospiraceae bacterium]
MKKLIILPMLCVLFLALTACGGQIVNQPLDNVSEITTKKEATETSSFENDSPIDEQSGDSALGGYIDFNEVFDYLWINASVQCMYILQEREWIKNYEQQFGMTFEELMSERFQWGQTDRSVTSESLRILRRLQLESEDRLQEFYDSIPREDWYHVPWFLDALSYFSVSEEELIRQNNREKAALVRCEETHGIDCSTSFYIFADEEINLLFSSDIEKIIKSAINDYSVIGDNNRVYSLAWLIEHSVEDYLTVGITPEMIEERLELFNEFYFTPEEARAFGSKLSDFTGRDVVFNAVS